MPSKRQPSKQRRASENRAKRQALAARSVHAQTPSVPRSRSRTSGSSSTGGSGTTSTSTRASATSGGSGLGGLFGFGGGGVSGVPGLKAVQLAFILAPIGFFAALFIPVQVDDRGEEVPILLKSLYMEARSLLVGQTVETEDASLISARGWSAVALALVPLLIAVGTYLSFRRRPIARTLTISMLLMAVGVVLTGDRAFFYMPSLIAIAVGSFQLRKADMRAATEAADPRGGGEAEDEDEYEDDDLVDSDDEDADEAELSEYEDGDEYDEEDLDAEDDEASEEEPKRSS